uniref:T cell receptor beta variable 16 n=1 Tax=Chlorocebus sabaeus TaxID=60711 RepID=A0A0D9R5Y2_CHLSB
MSPIFTYFTILCLLAAGSPGEEVTQTPKHLVKGEGQKAKLYCAPITGHSYVFWYQQVLRKEFKFLISFQNKNVFDETGMPKERFSAKCPPNSPCSLEIQATKLKDSAVYFCASSQSTVLNIS